MKNNRWINMSLAAGMGILLCFSLSACSVLPEADPEPEYEIVGTSHGMYAYETLNEEEKQVYDEITYAIENRLDSITVSTTDEDLLNNVHWAVYYDHCEYFWSATYQYEIYTNQKDEVVKLVFQPIFTMDQEQQEDYQNQIDQAAARILSEAPVDGSDYEKALYVYRTLIEQTDYEIESENNQNIISVFLNHETVCLGYAYGAQYLLNQLDIPCTTIYGTSEEGPHSWNLIQMDGEYYYMDVTWGEVSYWQDVGEVPPEETGEEDLPEDTDAAGDREAETINYSYFGVADTDTGFMAKHQAYAYVLLPACTATENNYYIHEGLHFDTWDKEAVGEKIRNAYESGEPGIFLKFATEEIYDQAFSYLIEDGNWYRYCDLKQIVYVDHFEENVLMFEF